MTRSLSRHAAWLLLPLTLLCGREPYQPTFEEVAEHRAEVYRLASEFVVETFNLVVIEMSEFNPVRFNSTGIWGDFESRLKELGDDRFEVQGWVEPEGHDGARVVWSVVIQYRMVDPEAWRYRRVDDPVENEPRVTSWRFGEYRSVPYEANYSADMMAKLLGRRDG